MAYWMCCKITINYGIAWCIMPLGDPIDFHETNDEPETFLSVVKKVLLGMTMFFLTISILALIFMIVYRYWLWILIIFSVIVNAIVFVYICYELGKGITEL